ncbi:MAG: 3-phosphoshikimate 1-carboxyvinyltransferase [Acutalibacteraceae bacterium]|jgi:3-phosphoshikimate 1-carboxyvinyltransferase
MSVVTCFPGKIAGAGAVPPSKSAAHRALIAAALAGGEVIGIAPSADIDATLDCLSALGIAADRQGDRVGFSKGALGENRVADCRESGSTLRFLIPLFGALGISATFTGRGRLPSRPLGVYADCLPSHGMTLQGDGLPLRVSGRLTAGEFALPGNVSSQFLTGLLFALPLCEGDSVLRLTTPLESAGYVEMTLQTLRRAGITAKPVAGGWAVPGGQTYRPVTHTVEKDWSQAAFLLAAAAVAGEVTLRGLDPNSAQGDKEIVSLLRRFGANVTTHGDTVVCRKAPLKGITLDAAQIPDLVPILAVIAAFADGDTRITGAGRLRIKESDRLAAVADGIRRIGGAVMERPDGLIVHGGRPLTGGAVEGYNDHRIVMSMAVAALGSSGAIRITDGEAVGKSWPTFFEDYQAIGGKAQWDR